MNVPRSDTLVFFGASDDLAYKKIFPLLQAMVKRGHIEDLNEMRGWEREL
jgi:glucose-6-phosphate 1-dehydrogenase